MATAYLEESKGFTLVELAIVVILIGIVMTMGLKTLTATLDNATFSETKAKQERIKSALVSHLRTNGVLPCPDNSAAVATGIGPQPPATTCSANAPEGYGVIPWQTLGISRETVIDGWGNYFTYRVANGSGGARDWTGKTSASAFTINELKAPTDALTVQELKADGSGLEDVTKKAVVVIVSHGKNGFGAKTTKVGDRMPTAEAGDGEKTNATDGTATFVRRPVNDDAAAVNGPYDDFVAYMEPRDLLQPLINEGTLKACAAYCSSAVTSVCSIPAQTCQCTAAGLNGVPGGISPCSATCGPCNEPTISGCHPSSSIPVGASPTTCQ